MSALQKSFAKAKLSGLPFNPPLPPGPTDDVLAEEDRIRQEHGAEDDELAPLPEHVGVGEAASDDSSSSASSASSVDSTGTIRPEPRKRLFARPRGAPSENSRSNYSPLPWTSYFEQEFHLWDNTSPLRHHVYLSPPTQDSAPLFVLHHGAGSSGLSFAACTEEMRKLAPEIGVLSIDARGHGETVIVPKSPTPGSPAAEGVTTFSYSYEEQRQARKQGEHKDGVLDLSLDTLSADLEKILRLLVPRMGWKDLPNLILVGHSLGGAVITNVAKNGKLGKKVLGYAVLDVVEGSAIDALQSMQTYLSSRPKAFPSIEAAIEWHLRSRTIRTFQSARISVPSLLHENPPRLAISGSKPPEPFNPADYNPVTTFPNTHPNTFTSTPSVTSDDPNSTISIDNSTHLSDPTTVSASTQSSASTDSTTISPPATEQRYTWRTDLRSTGPFWENWFVGLSSKFLGARGGKLLLLAGTDRLDKELMIGQMQGKYQLQVYPDAGHFIQEDLPGKTAIALIDFWRRNDGKLVLPPKVGALLKKKLPSGVGAAS